MATQSVFNVRNLTLVTGGTPALHLETERPTPESGPFDAWPFVSDAKIINRADHEGGHYADWCFWDANPTRGTYENDKIGAGYAAWLIARMQWDDGDAWDVEDVLPKIIEDQARVLHDDREAEVIRAFWCEFGFRAAHALEVTRHEKI